MKTLFSISLLFVLLWQPLYQSGYIAYWQLNKEKIAKTECINRFKPMMHCNGKCQLYQELKKAADQEAEDNKLPVAVLKLKTLETFIEMPSLWQPQPRFFYAKNATSFLSYPSNPSNGYLDTLLQPPQAV